MNDKPRHNRPGVTMLFGLCAAGILTIAGCASSGPPRTAAVPKEHTGPISVDITAVPAGSTTLTILKDKQDCDSYSHFDARLFAQCMEKRGYAVAVYGPNHQRTTIEELYAPRPSPSGTAPAPTTAPTATAPAPQSVPVAPASNGATPAPGMSIAPMLTEQQKSMLLTNMLDAAVSALPECFPELFKENNNNSNGESGRDAGNAQDGNSKNVRRFVGCELVDVLKQVGSDTQRLFCYSPTFDHAIVERLKQVSSSVSEAGLTQLKPLVCREYLAR